MATFENHTHVRNVRSNEVPLCQEMTHLRIRRNSDKPYIVVEDRVSSGRKTFYSLMGSGLHGLNGLPVKTSLRIYNSYVIPRCLYGLESVKITDTAKSKLTTLHRYCLRCILGLPKWTAIPALHILSGQLPIEFTMDIRCLTFIRSLMSIEPTKDIILRQYVVKPPSSNSLIINLKQKLQEYHLRSILELYEDIPDKQTWKKEVKATDRSLVDSEGMVK